MRALVETGVLVGERGAYRLEMPSRACRCQRLCRPSWRRASTGSARGEAPAPDRCRHWYGSAPATAAGHCRGTRGEPAARPGAAPGHRISLRDAPLSRARVHLQARPQHEVAYGSLLLERRRVLHARIVAALEAFAGDRVAEQVERLAHHALRGEVWDKALAYCRQALALAEELGMRPLQAHCHRGLGTLYAAPRPARGTGPHRTLHRHCPLL